LNLKYAPKNYNKYNYFNRSLYNIHCLKCEQYKQSKGDTSVTNTRTSIKHSYLSHIGLIPGIWKESETFEVFWTVMVCTLEKFVCGHFFPQQHSTFNTFLIHQFMFDQKGVKRGSYILQFRANRGSIFAGGSQIYPLYNTYTFK
jgi:hypothetical protein